ncbi:MAG TPA: MauE/DoxX family redox-associated membrane protein [Candidatus Acidoferrum sp.]|nr:MauE/DoxX family redox-associated membrane protein [Candidatus Acidoferrum sp.]
MGATEAVSNARALGAKRDWVTNNLALYARVALGAGFLSAVADRFGYWGPPGSPKAAWGDWSNFVKYTALLNFFLPHRIAPALAVLETIVESTLGVLLIVGVWKRQVAALAALLLLLFALAMTLALGIKAPLDYSVFSAAGAAAMLFVWAGQEREAKE